MMRKQLLILALAVGSVSFAQQLSQSRVATKEVVTLGQEKIDRSTVTNKAAQINSNWFSYVNGYEEYFGQSGTASLSANNLFPDTTILVDYAGSYSGPWIHAVSTIYDFKAAPFENPSDPTQNFVHTKDYVLDSINTTGIYTRVSGSSVVDTLVIKFYVPSADNLGSRSYFYNSAINTSLGADTVFLTNFNWDYATLTTPGVLKEMRILMDDAFAADTTSVGYNEINEYVNQNITAGTNATFNGLLGVSMEFHPGEAWSANMDTLGVNRNSWRFFSWELNGDDTFPYYDKQDANLSNILPQDVRYDVAGGWNGSYIPSYAYMGATGSSYAYEAHEISVHITQDVGNIGIAENEKIDFNVYPNPTNGNVNVRFGVIVNGEYNVRLVNIIGQEVFSENTTITSGETKAYNFEGLDKGVYLLNVSGNGLNTVQKVVIR